MKTRLKWSLVVGFVLSLSLHITSAVITALYPYHDEPKTPKLAFIYLLWPGWLITGGPLFGLGKEIIAAAINGIVYCFVVFSLLVIWKMWHRGTRLSNGTGGQRAL